MGRKTDALLGRTFKPYKFKALVNVAISRLAILKNQRQSRYSQARSDVVQLLQLGYHERALLRVEHVIKEQNMLDVLGILENYCNLVIERTQLVGQERVCPDELREAVAGLIYASSRCGDFPELQGIRAVFVSRFGKEFAANAVELRNKSGVNPMMIQKLSTRLPSLENRMEALKKIATENSIILQLEEPTKEDSGANLKQNQLKSDPQTNANCTSLPEEVVRDEGFPDSMMARKKYKDVADAAEAAFKSAAYAAAAARAAVELSRSEPRDPDDPSTSRGQVYNSHNKQIHNENEPEESKQNKTSAELQRSLSASSSDSTEDIAKVTKLAEADAKVLEKDLVVGNNDNETRASDISKTSMETEDLYSVIYPSSKEISFQLKSGLKIESKPGQITAEGSRMKTTPRLKTEKQPISVRTRQVRGY